jgi:hypothetical protein
MLKPPLVLVLPSLLILQAVLMLAGCASGKNARNTVKNAPIRVYASEKKVPSWITDIPDEKRYFYYVGTSTDTSSFDAGKEEAVGDALSQVVATIGIRASSTASYEERYFAEEYTTSIETELITEGRAKLQDAEIREIYYERWEGPQGNSFFRVWVLLKYSKEEIEKEQARLAEILQLKYGEIQKFEEMAAQYEQDNLLVRAVSAHLSASVSALKIDDGEVYFDRNIIQANEILLKLRISKSNEDQIGYVGQPLPEPLLVRVYYLSDGREIPVPDVPLRFSYRIPKTRSAGYKWLVSSDITDQNGFAEYEVDMIHEVSDENRVDVRLDLTPYMDQLKAAPAKYRESIESLEDVLSTKKTSLKFKSDTKAREIKTAVFFIQRDNDGSLISKPSAAPAFYDVLYAKDFIIRVLGLSPDSLTGMSDDEIWQELDARAGKGTGRIIFGKAQIIEYDTISGYETATASAEASLLNRESGEIIRTWQIQRSGTGDSAEAAQLNALIQVGKSLGEIVSNTIP